MAITEKDKIVWAELKDSWTLWVQVKRRTIQDATFIEADPGSSKKLRGDDAKDSSQQRCPGLKKEMSLISATRLAPQKKRYRLLLIRRIETSTAKLQIVRSSVY